MSYFWDTLCDYEEQNLKIIYFAACTDSQTGGPSSCLASLLLTCHQVGAAFLPCPLLCVTFLSFVICYFLVPFYVLLSCPLSCVTLLSRIMSYFLFHWFLLGNGSKTPCRAKLLPCLLLDDHSWSTW